MNYQLPAAVGNPPRQLILSPTNFAAMVIMR